MSFCAVVVLYDPCEETTAKLINALTSQNVFCVIVDNSSVPANVEYKRQPELIYRINNLENLGIATAQNMGLNLCINKGFTCAFLFDQDSQIDSAYIKSMVDLYQDLHRYDANIAAIGPSILSVHSGKIEKPFIQNPIAKLSDSVNQVSQIIASGMLLNLRSFQDVGPKEEALFIDGVDHEWCWRAYSKGFKIAQACNLVLTHKLGDSRVNVGRIQFKIGSPVRLYYQTRNWLILSRRSYVPMYWKIRNLCYFPMKCTLNVLFVSHRRSRAYYLFKGLLDGFRGKTGKCA